MPHVEVGVEGTRHAVVLHLTAHRIGPAHDGHAVRPDHGPRGLPQQAAEHEVVGVDELFDAEVHLPELQLGQSTAVRQRFRGAAALVVRPDVEADLEGWGFDAEDGVVRFRQGEGTAAGGEGVFLDELGAPGRSRHRRARHNPVGEAL